MAILFRDLATQVANYRTLPTVCSGLHCIGKAVPVACELSGPIALVACAQLRDGAWCVLPRTPLGTLFLSFTSHGAAHAFQVRNGSGAHWVGFHSF